MKTVFLDKEFLNGNKNTYIKDFKHLYKHFF